jgi:formate/nitrite transporter FocA (FNT family)
MATPDTSRLSAREIFERVGSDARAEIARPPSALAFSALFAGLAMGLSGLGVAAALTILGDGPGDEFVASLLYPIGFLAVILGRAQLFTENTLYPVALILAERRHVLATARLWIIVFTANVLGALLFAVLAVKSGALDANFAGELDHLGKGVVEADFATNFWSGVVGGWIIALVAWLVAASHWTVGQFFVIYALTFLVGLGRFDHCIASAGEALAAVVAGEMGAGTFLTWLAAATLGNIAGGVGIVALLNYGQVASGDDGSPAGSG